MELLPLQVGYRDSFGENDDSCFHLLERYDDSGAVLRLLQSRGRVSRDQISPLVPDLAEDDTLVEEVTEVVEA